jgi:hypothetical protein
VPDLRRAPSFRSGALQFDYETRNRETMNAMQQARRRADVATGSKPRARHRPRTSEGYPVQVRNGMPAPRLRVVTDTARCGCVRRLRPVLMDWELTVSCGADHA